MPEKQEKKRSPVVAAEIAAPAAGPRYAELRAKTNFSFLEGASHPDELVARAAELGYAALAITDRSSLAGVVRAHVAAKQAGLKLLIGAELTPVDAPPLVVWATDRPAYGLLSRLITRGRTQAPKGECRLTLTDIAEHADGLLAGLIGEPSDAMLPYREIFADRCYLLTELHRGADDQRYLDECRAWSREQKIPLAAAGGVYFHHPDRRPLCDVLTAIRAGCTVADAGELLFPNAERFLKAPAEIAGLFASAPEAIARTIEIADRCTFSLDDLRYEYPEELAPSGQTPLEYLTQLTWAGARERYPAGIPDKVRGLLEHELKLIAELRYEAYFLTVWDLVRFARSRDILCQGRGSAANSAVCYCLGVTSVDPGQLDVLFERFISRERNEAPDIDVDFEHERREEVLQYLYDKYGRERAGMTAEVISYRPRSAVRDVGKALGLSLDRVDALAKVLDSYRSEALDKRCRQAGLDPDSQVGRQLLKLVGELLGFPRHLGQHVGGMVMTRGPLCELCPIENAAMPGRTVIEWDKDDLDEIGILKVDCLSLGMLTAIRKCFAMVEQHHGRRLTLANIPEGDQSVYEMICRADTMGVFQIESRAQMSMLPRLRPKTYYDLVIEVAIVRPGPIQGNMVHPYLRRRAGEEPITYPNDAIRGVLEKTLGVPLFQEQAMQLAVVAAGFTPGEADQLRRAMGAWRRPGLIADFGKRLVDGMVSKGLTPEFADHVFSQIRGFGEYGFPESHAASFALLVYVSAWLKHYYPAAFCAALLNSQPMGFYAPAQLVKNAQEHDVEIRPIDVNFSGWDCLLEARGAGEGGTRDSGLGAGDSGLGAGEQVSTDHRPLTTDHRPLTTDYSSPADHRPPTTDHSSAPDPRPLNPDPYCVRLGLRMIGGLSQELAKKIEEARADGPFRSLDDFTRRTRFSQAVLTRLAEADAFGSLTLHRRDSLWMALAQEQKGKPRPLFAELTDEEPLADLPPMSGQEEVFADYQSSGLSLKAHPVSFYRAQLDQLGVLSAARLADLTNGRFVRVGGLVLMRQRPSTARGITFVTIEDETGTANLIVKMEVWERYYQVARTASAFIAHGRLQKQNQIIHVLVSRLENMAGRLGEMKSQSRDFR